MTKGSIVESIFVSVNGGRPNTDLSVQREDISALLPAAVNYAITGDYWVNVSRENDREVPNSFVSEFYFPAISEEMGREFIPFDKKVINIPGNGGLRYVQDALGNSYSPRAIGVSKKSYWDKAMTAAGEFQFKEGRIYLYNRPPLAERFYIGAVMDVSELSDDDELPIPAGSEPQVIDILMSFFTNQRMQPKDYVINSVDPINEIR